MLSLHKLEKGLLIFSFVWVDIEEISSFKNLLFHWRKKEGLSFVSVRLMRIASVNKNI
jgi:hypothetical protein